MSKSIETLIACAIADIEGLLVEAYPDGSEGHPARKTLTDLYDAWHNQALFSWHIDDVAQRARETDCQRITPDQCREVLRRVEKNHDCEVGVNWDVLDAHIEEVVGG